MFHDIASVIFTLIGLKRTPTYQTIKPREARTRSQMSIQKESISSTVLLTDSSPEHRTLGWGCCWVPRSEVRKGIQRAEEPRCVDGIN